MCKNRWKLPEGLPAFNQLQPFLYIIFFAQPVQFKRLYANRGNQ
jgi:hypothetical protein